MKRWAILLAMAVTALGAHSAPSLTWTLNLERGTVNFGRYAPYAGHEYPVTISGGDAGTVYTAYVMSDDGRTCLAKTTASGGAYSIAFNTEDLWEAFVRDMHEMRTFHCIFRDPSRVVAEGDLTVVWNPLWKDTGTGAVYTMKGAQGLAGEQGEKGDTGLGDPAALALKWDENASYAPPTVVYGYDSQGKLHFYECIKANVGKPYEDGEYWQAVDLNTFMWLYRDEQLRAYGVTKDMRLQMSANTEAHHKRIYDNIVPNEIIPYDHRAFVVKTNVAERSRYSPSNGRELFEKALEDEVARAFSAEDVLTNMLGEVSERIATNLWYIQTTGVAVSNDLGKTEADYQAAKARETLHFGSTNPHEVKASQLDAYTTNEVMELVSAWPERVTSVNGKTGDVQLVATDIGAVPIDIPYVTNYTHFSGRTVLAQNAAVFGRIMFDSPSGGLSFTNHYSTTTLFPDNSAVPTVWQGSLKWVPYWCGLYGNCSEVMIPLGDAEAEGQGASFLQVQVLTENGETTLGVSQSTYYQTDLGEWRGN